MASKVPIIRRRHMYYEDQRYKHAIKEEMRIQIIGFITTQYRSQYATEQHKEQIKSLSLCNVARLTQIDRYQDNEDLDDSFNDFIEDIVFRFTPVNTQDLFSVRLENFLLRLALMFGQEVIDEMIDDFKNHILSVHNASYKYKFLVFKMKRNDKRFKKNLDLLFEIFPFLWMIPYFAEIYPELEGKDMI